MPIVIIGVCTLIGGWVGYLLGPSFFGMHLPLMKILFGIPHGSLASSIQSEARTDLLMGLLMGIILGLVLNRVYQSGDKRPPSAK